uniref:Uncharacterized protein n=3 Tax=Avena sativa TaxID=4498 RepID=A0ACD6ARN9_AVESA
MVAAESLRSLEMALSLPTMFYGVLSLLLLCLVWWLLELLWWKPRRLERVLRAQGLTGTSYHFLTGDLKVEKQLKKEALSRPLPLRCHDIVLRILPFHYQNVQAHGKTCLSWSGPIPTVAMCDPGLVKEMLSDKLGYFGKPQFPAVGEMLGNGLAQQEGDKWAQHRKVINPAFSLQEIKHTTPAFSSCCEEMVSRWAECLRREGGTYCEVDVWPELSKLSGDAISRTAFSSSYLEGRRVFQLQSEQVKRLVSTFLTILVPGYLYLPTENNRKMHQIKKEIESTLRGIIGKRVQEMEDGITTKQDILGLLLESNMMKVEEKGKPCPAMTIEEIIEHCKVFYFAGSETTAILLTWTMVLLSMHPEWQVSARKEVLGLFGKNKPKYEDLSGLKTVTMILHEVLRLYPPVTLFKRKTYKEAKIGGVRYPAGVMVDIPVLLIHHDPDIWGSNVHEFHPERFAEGVAKASKFQGAFLPFSSGPRICIGQNFAMVEAKIALCMILQHFEFELAPTYTHAPHVLLTLEPMHGAQINLRAI